MKRIIGILCAVVGIAGAQEFDFNLDTLNPEASYLQESVEQMLIREQSRAEGRDMKQMALRNIDAAIKRGVTSGEVFNALEYLALEGTVRRTAYQNRIGYPDIRSKAAAYLGVLGSPEAHRVLMQMANVEIEPTVLIQVVTALKQNGANENQETVQAITGILNRFDMFSPDNLLALSGIEAYETFAAQNGGKLDLEAMTVIAHIADGRYHGLIRQRARDLLAQLRAYRRNSAGS